MMLSVVDTELWLSAVVETEETVGAVLSVLVVVLSDVLSSDVLSSYVLSSDVLSSTASSVTLQLTAVPIIIQNKIKTILLCVIFLTDKDMIPLNNPSITNIINHLGIIERSCEICLEIAAA